MKRALSLSMVFLCISLMVLPYILVFASDVPDGFMNPLEVYDVEMDQSHNQIVQMFFANPEIKVAEVAMMPYKANWFLKQMAFSETTDENYWEPVSGDMVIVKRGEMTQWNGTYRSEGNLGYSTLQVSQTMTIDPEKSVNLLLTNQFSSVADFVTEFGDAHHNEQEGQTNKEVQSGWYTESGRGLCISLPIYADNNVLGTVGFQVLGVKTVGGTPFVNNDVVNTDADADHGEIALDISSDIVDGKGTSGAGLVLSISVAIGGALLGAAGASARGADKDQTIGKSSSYQMRIFKDFGDKIKYDGEPVFIYARMVEITDQGIEKERPDLTEEIEIFTESGPIQVSHMMMSGAYKGANIMAESTQTNMASEGIISFKFTGTGGTFQNNVTFKLVGEPSVILKGKYVDSLYLQAGSQKVHSVMIKPIDFLSKPAYSIASMTDESPFSVELSVDHTGQPLLVVTNQSEKKEPITQFYETYNVELIAENEKEFVRTWVRVIICHEGLVAEFHGGTAEVKGYYDRQTGLMAETIVDFKLGVWSESDENLDFSLPEELSFTYSDESRICEIIGLAAEKDLDCADRTVTRYRIRAEKPFPNDEPIEGDFLALCNQNDVFYEYNRPVPLMPDIQIFNKNEAVEEEYQNCLYMIREYMPEDHAEKLLRELENNRQLYNYGAEDYRIYRHYVWNRAQYYLMVENRDYMRDAAFWDDMIVIAEWTKFIGDIALEIALMPVGGPLATFVIKNGKDLLIALSDAYQTKGSISLDDVWTYLKGVMGNMEDISASTPSPTEYKKLAIWLMCFFVYRIFYNRSFGKGSNGKDIDSWSDAILQSFKDLTIKTILMGFVARQVGQADASSTHTLPGGTHLTYNTHVDVDIMRPVTDVGDNVINAIDQKTASWVDRLCQYLDDIVDGNSRFS